MIVNSNSSNSRENKAGVYRAVRAGRIAYGCNGKIIVGDQGRDILLTALDCSIKADYIN
jgi:hypothetical protein